MAIDNQKQIKTFLTNITAIRRHYGLSKKQMTQLLGISIQSLNKIEKGEMPNLSVNILYRVYDLFGIKSSELFTEKLFPENE